MKRCTHCKKIKPLADFKTDKRRLNGKASWCKICSISSCEAWRIANPEKATIDNRRVRNNHHHPYGEHKKKIALAWRLANPERLRAYDKAYRKKHPEKFRIKNRIKEARRRARLAGVGGNHTSAQINQMLIAQKFKCANCHISIRKRYHEDHVLPIALGGSNDIGNIQLLCPPCNQSNRSKHPIAWAQENGRLI